MNASTNIALCGSWWRQAVVSCVAFVHYVLSFKCLTFLINYPTLENFPSQSRDTGNNQAKLLEKDSNQSLDYFAVQVNHFFPCCKFNYKTRLTFRQDAQVTFLCGVCLPRQQANWSTHNPIINSPIGRICLKFLRG